MPCPCRVPSGRFPASSRVSAPRFLPNRRTASATNPADGKRRVSRAKRTTPWAAAGEVPTVSVRRIQCRISWNLSNTPAISELRPVEPAVKSGVGSPLAPNRTSSNPSLSVYWQYTRHPQITHTSPTAGRFPPGGPATRPTGPRGIASTRVWQPPHGRCADDVTQGRVYLPPTIAGLAAPRKGKLGSGVQVVAAIEA